MKLVIACGRPGLMRGGVANPHVAVYDINHFTTAELEQLIREPAISVVLGTLLTVNADGAIVAAADGGHGTALVYDPTTGALFDPRTALGDGETDTGKASTMTAAVAEALGATQVSPPKPSLELPVPGDVHIEVPQKHIDLHGDARTVPDAPGTKPEDLDLEAAEQGARLGAAADAAEAERAQAAALAAAEAEELERANAAAAAAAGRTHRGPRRT